ncbi:hypothetical protein HYU17_01940 [Candidatus Woesearchaeota archaeon]|nr:hypothetical protein [Candidatus Woesearchaeota archaeon]
MQMQEVQSLTGMEERLSDLRRKLMTLEWDKSHNEFKYSQIKTECESLQKKVEGIKAEIREQETVKEAKETATAAEAKEQPQAATES